MGMKDQCFLPEVGQYHVRQPACHDRKDYGKSDSDHEGSSLLSHGRVSEGNSCKLPCHH